MADLFFIVYRGHRNSLTLPSSLILSLSCNLKVSKELLYHATFENVTDLTLWIYLANLLVFLHSEFVSFSSTYMKFCILNYVEFFLTIFGLELSKSNTAKIIRPWRKSWSCKLYFTYKSEKESPHLSNTLIIYFSYHPMSSPHPFPHSLPRTASLWSLRGWFTSPRALPRSIR